MNNSDDENRDPYDRDPFCNENKNKNESSQQNADPNGIRVETHEELPECVEKYLITMLLKLRENSLNEDISLSLKNDFCSLTETLAFEYNSFDLSAETISYVDRVQGLIENKYWKQAEKELLRLLKILRPFDLEDLFSLMEKTKIAEAKIKDKDVVLLIGRTGSGKSTTLHCLAGSKFKKDEDHYEPFEFPNDLLKQVKTSMSANSETRYILPIELDLKTLINRKGSVFLCDTPGFNDTAGSEVDIANTYGIIEAIKECKTVRLVVIISSKSLGDRYEGIIEMAELLHQMIPKIEDHLKSVAYVYTKFSSVDNITRALTEALQKDDLSEPITEIIESMLEETPILIDPLDPVSAKKALKKINKMAQIEYPNGIFKNIINSKAYACLMEQLNLHERAIDTALATQNFDLITFKLNQLYKLKTFLKINYESDRINIKLNRHFIELYKTCWDKIKTWSKDEKNILNQSQVDEINKTIQKFKTANFLISKHLLSKFDYVHDLRNAIVGECSKIFEAFKNGSCESQDEQQIIHNLENIKTICSGFSDERLDKLFTDTRDQVLEKFESKTNLIQKLLDDQVLDFDQLAEILNDCKRLKTIYKNNFESKDELDLENKYKRACRIFKEFFEAREKEILDNLAENEKENIEFLIKLIENLHKSLDCVKLCALIDREDLKRVLRSINDFVLRKIEFFIHSIESVISQSEVDKHMMQAIEINYNEIKRWREIGDSAYVTSDAFHKLKNKIVDFLFDLNKSMLEDSFDSFRNNNEKVNFEAMKTYFEMMKNAQWLDELKENFYFDMYKKFEVDLLKRAKDLSVNYANFSISVENYKNIKDANQTFAKMVRFGPLTNTNDEIRTLVENVEKDFKHKMQSAFSVIQKELIEDNLKKEKLKCSFLDCAFKFIDEATSNSVTVINLNELEVLKNSIKEFLLSYHDSVDKEFEENFRTIKNSDVPSEEIMTEACEKMLSRFKEFLIMKSSHSSIYQLVNSHEDLLDKWKGSLVAYSSELSETMNFSRLNQQDRELNTKILTSKILSYFDGYFDSRSNRLFYDLYIKYQTESIEETISLRKTIIELLNRRDFSTVRIELSRLDDMKISTKNLNDIRNSINLAIESLIELVESSERKITKELSQDTVEDLIINLKTLRKLQREILDFSVDEQASEKSNYSKVVDKKISKDLKSSLENINKKIFAKLTAYLEFMEKSIDSDDFYEVEERRDKFDQVRSILADHFSDFDDIQKKFDSIETKLETIVESLVDKYDKMPLEEYKNNYPRDFFEKLEKIKAKKQKYTEAYRKIEQQIIRNIREYLKNCQEKTLEERLDFIESLLWYLPENIKQRLSSEIAQQKKTLGDRKTRLERDLERSLKLDDVAKIFALKNTLTHGMQDLSDLFEQKFSENLENKIFEMKMELRDQGIEKAVKKLETISKYFGKMSEEKIANEVSCGIEDEFYKKFEKVKHVFRIVDKTDLDELEKVAGSVGDFFIYFRVFRDRSFKAIFKNNSNFKVVENEMKEFVDFFKGNRREFDECLETTLFGKLIKTLNISLKCDKVLRIAKDKLLKSDFDLDLSECGSISLIKSLNERVESLTKQILSTNFMDMGIVKYEKDRESFYTDIHSKLKFLIELNGSPELKDISEKYIKNMPKFVENETKVKNYLNKSVMEMSKHIETIMEVSEKFNDIKMKDLRLYYENLVSFERVFGENLSTSSSLKDIQNRLLNKCKSISLEVNPNPANIETTVTSLLNLKLVSDNLTSLKSKVDALIEESLKIFQKSKGCLEMLNLASALEDDDTGLLILREYQIFKGEMIRHRDEKTAKHDIDYVLENLRGDAVAKDQLKKRYSDFEVEYTELIKKNIASITNGKTMDKLVNETKNILPEKKKNIFGSDVRNKIPKLVAHIFAVWTLKNTKYYNEMKEVSNKDAYLLKPHPAQVIAIFRLLGNGYDTDFLTKISEIFVDSDLQNNLVQVGTGEGKSVILAVVSIVLALAGFDVSCACYSNYLSERDYNDFVDIFLALGVENHVFYGTFDQVCEKFLNRNDNIRTKVVRLIKLNASTPAKPIMTQNMRPKILLIDEVDVFFNKEFLGNLYIPLTRLKDPTITNLLNYVWKERKSVDYQSLKSTSEYKNCKEKFSEWIGLVDEALKDVLDDLKSYKSHEYLVFQDRIGYKRQDSVHTNTYCGYKTLFAYYHEHDRGKISTKSLNDSLSLGIYCGCFSYCEIPKKFEYILGVTGTLETLSSTQKKIIDDMYKIKISTYIPSVYGARKLVFHNEADTLVSTKVDFHLRLKDEIDKRILGTVNVEIKRAVMVFFDKEETLNSFYKSPQLESYKNKDEVNILKEDVTLNDKIYFIKKAMTSGKITLLTRSFGRGIDFICTSRSMLTNGGVHVIQTFLSKDPSEQIQIMGRTARQGETGSYSLILIEEDLQKYLGIFYKAQLETMQSNALVYQGLNEKRNAYFNKQTESILKAIEDVKANHDTSEEFLNRLFTDDFRFVKNFLIDKNRGAGLASRRSKTIFLMDATGSMGHLLDQVKNTICVMFDRAISVLKEYSLPADLFEIQLVVYRDYESRQNVLQASSWETKPLNLRQFMGTVSAQGGGDYEEAIEIGLWHVNQEQKKLEYPDKISQVILIGDAPAKSKTQISQSREVNGGEAFWKSTKFKTPTHYKTELNSIKACSIPVHTFYVMKGPEECFAEIASTTGGQTGFLDVNSENSAQRLIDCITPLILSDVGTLNGGMGSELVEEYKRKYPKSYA